MKLARRVADAKAFDPYRGDPLFLRDDPEAYVRARAETLYHPVGTCKMGQDAWSVVNSRLQVYGVTASVAKLR